MRRIFAFFCIFFAGSPLLYSQDTGRELGLPFIRNYSSKEYNAFPQNWAIVQDSRGVMYFGNGDGVLEYDGASWRLTRLANLSAALSLAIDKDGRIYVGGINDIGYLMPDSLGQMKYVSLTDFLKPEDREFGQARGTYATSEGIYFRTANQLLRWSNNQFSLIKPENRFHVTFLVNQTVYVRQIGVGLMQVAGDAVRLVPDGEKFAQERIYSMLPYEGNRILIGTRTQGFFLYDGVTTEAFPTEADDFIKENQIYHGAVLSDGTFAIATRLAGVAIID